MIIPENEPVWFGFDAGTVRCGLARADAGSSLASPLAVVPTEPRSTLASRVQAALGGRAPRGLVVGLPLDARGEEGPAAELARELGELVAAELGCEVHYIDERFTTAAMHVRRREAGISGKRRANDIDAWAAAAILQTFLDRQRNQRSEE